MSQFMMSDARSFTDYTSSSIRDDDFKKINGITDDTMFRNFIRINGEQIIQQNKKHVIQCYCINCTVNKSKIQQITPQSTLRPFTG